MSQKTDSPGVFIPPPLFFASIFLLSFLLQKWMPVSRTFFHTEAAWIAGIFFIIACMIIGGTAVLQFFKTRNTVVTVKPANSLQTSGIYSFSRNPMYLSLTSLYTGLALLYGNWWTLILIPVAVIIITLLVIKPEERYLVRAFGESYGEYKKQVRRWL